MSFWSHWNHGRVRTSTACTVTAEDAAEKASSGVIAGQLGTNIQLISTAY